MIDDPVTYHGLPPTAQGTPNDLRAGRVLAAVFDDAARHETPDWIDALEDYLRDVLHALYVTNTGNADEVVDGFVRALGAFLTDVDPDGDPEHPPAMRIEVEGLGVF